MARYIDAKNAADIISEKMNIPLGDLVDVFSEIPAADVAEVKHGHWIRKDYKPCGHDYICSVCGFGVPLEYKHCPECIAKMDIEKE